MNTIIKEIKNRINIHKYLRSTDVKVREAVARYGTVKDRRLLRDDSCLSVKEIVAEYGTDEDRTHLLKDDVDTVPNLLQDVARKTT